MDDTDILTHGRRLHNALRQAIEDGDGLRGEPQWENIERPGFEHHACGMYLASVLATLEGELNYKCWENPGSDFVSLQGFLEACPRTRYIELGIQPNRLNALLEIRNAIIHNSSNARKNRNNQSETMIVEANIPGVIFDDNTGEITLVSNDEVDFMEWVRVAYLCVTEYHGYWGGPNMWN